MNKEVMRQYPLRLRKSLKEHVDDLAALNRRSANAELTVLIEDGIKYRNLREKNHVK